MGGMKETNLECKVMTLVDEYLEDRVFHVYDEDNIATQVVTYSDVIAMIKDVIEKFIIKDVDSDD